VCFWLFLISVEIIAMKNILPFCIIFLLPIMSQAQVKSFELTNPNAIQLTDTCLKLLTSHSWRGIQINLDVRGTLTETAGRGVLKYSKDGTFTYRRSGTWKLIEGRYIKHEFEEEIEKEINFGGIYAVTELTDSILTLTKLLTSSHDMHRTMYFNSISKNPTAKRFVSKYSFGIKPIFSASIKYYEGKTDPASLDSISQLSKETLFSNNFIIIHDTIFVHTQDSLYQLLIKDKID